MRCIIALYYYMRYIIIEYNRRRDRRKIWFPEIRKPRPIDHQHPLTPPQNSRYSRAHPDDLPLVAPIPPGRPLVCPFLEALSVTLVYMRT